MKEVCFIHSYGADAFNKESVGGTELQLYYLSTALAREEDFEVNFITRTPTEKRIEGVNLVPGLGRVDSWSSKVLSGFKLLYNMNRINSDVYFSSSDNMIPFLVSVLCKFKGRKHIHRTVHERECDGSMIEENWFKGLMNYFGLRLTDLIFVQCKDHEEMLREWFNPELEVLPNSFPIPEKKEQEGDYILWVGRRVEWKKPEMTLKLAREFSSEKFVVISPRTSGEEDFYNKIEAEAEELSNVELIERVPREEIQDYFDNAKIFLNTSEKEGFPNTFVEAGIGVTPILSYKVDPDSFIEDKECGFSCEGDYSKLKSRMREMLENKVETRQKGENCRKYVEENHDISKNIQIVKRKLNELNE